MAWLSWVLQQRESGKPLESAQGDHSTLAGVVEAFPEFGRGFELRLRDEILGQWRIGGLHSAEAPYEARLKLHCSQRRSQAYGQSALRGLATSLENQRLPQITPFEGRFAI
jgi:hypothetical protein